MLEIAKYIRKPFEVDAVQVTEENMLEVSQWCNGDVRATPQGKTAGLSANFIAVRVARVTSPRQSQAFVGDWVLYAGTGYKVYTASAFKKTFDLSSGTAKDAAVQAAKPLEELRTVTEPVGSNVLMDPTNAGANVAG